MLPSVADDLTVLSYARNGPGGFRLDIQVVAMQHGAQCEGVFQGLGVDILRESVE